MNRRTYEKIVIDLVLPPSRGSLSSMNLHFALCVFLSSYSGPALASSAGWELRAFRTLAIHWVFADYHSTAIALIAARDQDFVVKKSLHLFVGWMMISRRNTWSKRWARERLSRLLGWWIHPISSEVPTSTRSMKRSRSVLHVKCL